MIGDKARTMSLKTPDGTRCVVDDDAKFNGLVLLSLEINQLSEDVAREVAPYQSLLAGGVQKSLQDSYVP
jgi:hypothetical protein